MVDAVVSYAVEKLGDFLIQKVVSRLNIGKDVEWLRNELQYMQSFLKDAEQKQTMDHLVRQWVFEITYLAHDTVDILDAFSVKVGSGETSKNGIADCLKRYACIICNKEADLYAIGNEIESLKERVLDLSRKRETYGITTIGDVGDGPINKTNMKEWRRTTSYAEEEHFVGYEDVTNMLLKELLKNDNRRSIISIQGMGGLGKTTLTRKLYNSNNAQVHFACRAWVCVSQEYSVQDLLRTVVKSFKELCSKEELEMIERMNEEDLERYLRKFLNEKRYLVVVDDVWRKEAWESLKRAFPDDRTGSRVIITTRKIEVAENVDDRSFVHHLRFLRPEESWDLFKKKISGDERARRFSPAMQQMGKEMVGKCGGLPLAIVVLGGLLSHKKHPEQWHTVKEQLWQHMKKNSIDISHLLSLSYNDLSSKLKQCFLYVGIFPEDERINARKLMWLWMAEGFISQSNKMEDIAEDYFNELTSRSLIQVVNKVSGEIKECKIHDLLRDLAVEKAREVKLFDIHDPRVYTGAHSSQRRLAIHTQIEKFFSVGVSTEKLRSLVFFNPDMEVPDIEKLKIICGKIKFLCVLDLEKVSFGYSSKECRLPDAIGDLIHLKFLGLMHTNLTQFPSAIGKLKSLQSLQISSRRHDRYSLPLEISKLINLRHLVVYNSEKHLKINTLTNLRTLEGVIYNQWIDIDTINLINLRELVVFDVSPIENRSVPYSLDSVSNLKSLTSLTLCSSSGIDEYDVSYLPSLQPLVSCPCLLRLYLEGKIKKLPLFDKLPQSLTELTLRRSELRKDPMPTLEKLLNLRSLTLYNAYDGKEIECSDDGFIQLEHLVFEYLPNLENWRLTETAMPVIRSLSITHCPKLRAIPIRLKSIHK